MSTVDAASDMCNGLVRLPLKAIGGRVVGGRRGVGHQPPGWGRRHKLRAHKGAYLQSRGPGMRQHAGREKRWIQIRVLLRSYGRSSIWGKQWGKNAAKQEERYRE